MDRDMMEILSEAGLLYEEYYGTPEAEGLQRGQRLQLPPCIEPIANAVRKASFVMYKMESDGNTDNPAYAVVKTAVERGVEILAFGSLEIMVGVLAGDQSCVVCTENAHRRSIADGIVSAIGSENAGHMVIPAMPGGVYFDLGKGKKPPGSTRVH